MTLELSRKKRTARRVGLSEGHMMRLARQGQFPHPVKIGPNSVGFVVDEVTQWIEERMAERDERPTSGASTNAA
ncbi:MAG: AlpA family phage regulatory protein [Alphaproteobacteria bacterium]|nr:AlpA family phage regulatory protein [Alphaproteobacteria bacterium]